MAEFARYYIAFLTQLFGNIWTYIKGRFQPIINVFTHDVPSYIANLQASVGFFGVGGWIVYIFVFLLSTILIFFLLYRVWLLIRRYLLFRSKEVEKDQIIEELAKTKDKVAKLTIEKNQLYALKVNSMYAGGAVNVNGSALPNAVNAQQVQLQPGVAAAALPAAEEPLRLESRFSKLSAIDHKYEISEPFISQAETEGMNLSQLVDNFVNFAASQHKLFYNKNTIRYFFAGVATTKVIILEGISGTGKTSLPYALGKFFDHSSSIVSVQPSWRDRGDLLGYLNEFTKTFNETDFLSSLYEATYREDPSIIVLDEMNLARIEYYFAEFLSIMEMPDKDEWTIDITPSAEEGDPKHLIDGKLLVPQSVWFVGTANQDDSTFTITDKVYDRTITIDLNTRGEYFDAPVTESVKVPYDYLEFLFNKAKVDNVVSDKLKDRLKAIDDFIMDKFKVTFGNRILKQIYSFIPVFVACGGTETDAVDFLLMSKIFRKFNALNLVFLKKELTALITLLDTTFGKGKCPMSAEYIRQLIRRA